MKIADRKQCSLSHIMENYTAHEIEYLRVYYSKEPSPAMRNDYLLSQLLSMFHNANFTTKKSPADFKYPELWKTPEQQDVDAIRKMLGV